MTNEEAAYIAGFLDADGSISGHTRSWGRVLPNVCITNTNRRVLEWMQGHLGGTISTQGQRAKYGHKPHNQLIFYSDNAERVLRLLLPHLRVKRMQAELAIIAFVNRGQTGRRLSPGDKALREWCGRTISGLNQGRVSVESGSLVASIPLQVTA